MSLLLLLEEAPSSGGDAQVGSTRSAAPQSCTARELVGFAVVFSSALMPNADRIGGAEYTVGTHAATLAQQNSSFVHGTPPQLFAAVADVSPPRTLIAAPPQIDSGSAHLTGPTPPSASPVIFSTRIAQPQLPPQGDFVRTGRVVASPLADVQIGRTFVAAPVQIDSGSTVLTGPTPEGIDKPPPHTLAAAPQQLDAYANAWLFGLFQPSTDPPPHTLSAAPQQSDLYASASVWGLFQPFVAATDPIIGKTATAAPQQLDAYANAWLFGLFQPSTDPPPRTLTAAPPQIESGAARVSGRSASLDVPITRLRVAAPAQIESGSSLVWGPFVVQIDSPTLHTLTAAPPHLQTGSADLFSFVYPAAVPPPRTLSAAPQSFDAHPTSVGYVAGLVDVPDVAVIPPLLGRGHGVIVPRGSRRHTESALDTRTTVGAEKRRSTPSDDV